MDGKLDWTLGAFYMEHEIENVIRGYRDDDLDGVFKYVCDEPFADPSYCYTMILVSLEDLISLDQVQM
ncbi:MAG: hypothetical protein CM15mP127_06560 [Gammaproteobacteria bacterium]|nr:MAG: hypothetical protein CM15mP127_06560 [Gammaproteobacteria bacterium]